MRNKNFITLIAAVILVIGFNSQAKEIPFPLPNHDGLPGDSKKPVKVYILAGQSNMVGMGNLSGAKNMYDGVFLSSDPVTPDSPLQIFKVGNYKTSPLEVFNADGNKVTEPISKGYFEVPLNGVYEVFSSDVTNPKIIIQIEGKRVFTNNTEEKKVKDSIELQKGQKYRFEIFGYDDKPPRFWMKKADLLGNGDLDAVVKRENKFSWLLDEKNDWVVRQDVYFQEARLAKDGKGSKLSAISNGKAIGPELGFGHVLGTYHDEQVLLIKTAQGNRSLGFDFRPPSSGRTDPDNQFEAAEYKLMIEGVRKTLDNLSSVLPDYQNQGYEMAGFVWFQGHKDSFSEQLIDEYEKNLVNLINDVRKEFKTPNLPAVVATVGFGGYNMQDKFLRIHKAQMAVGDKIKYPNYAGNVASVDTRDFWRGIDESPKSEDYHYNRNAETYMLIGDALGRAMLKLFGANVEPIPDTYRNKGRENVAENIVKVSEEEQEMIKKSLRPIVIDGIASSYINDPRNKDALVMESALQKPNRQSQFLRGAMFGLVNCYRAVGIIDYDWKPFGSNLDESTWNYFSFDPKEALPKDKGNRYRQVTLPQGMEGWMNPEFNPSKAGWSTGNQPFGQLGGKLLPLNESCTAIFCRCGEKPKTLWEKEVLMIRNKVKIPPIKDGHRYRIVVGGAAHVNFGEGFAIYVDGKLIGESKTGVAVRQGGQPRGVHIYSDFLKDLKDGEITIALTSFLRYNHPRRGVQPASGHISVQIEEQKIPPLN